MVHRWEKNLENEIISVPCEQRSVVMICNSLRLMGDDNNIKITKLKHLQGFMRKDQYQQLDATFSFDKFPEYVFPVFGCSK